jgi:hypothetical protein
MAKHLQSCIPKHLEKGTQDKKSKPQPFFCIVVQGAYLPEYWLHLKASGNATLKRLDQFLRDIWLECCGHMSAFRDGRGQIGMGRKLMDVFEPGIELIHEYDFGDTTVLRVKVLGQYEGMMEAKSPIEILARNEPPEIPCDSCGAAIAAQICLECQGEGSGMLCKACAESHGCDEEMRLPVANSPRTGVCGYTG